jgi:membrane protease YdiL (CAAX protease family)
MPGDDAGFPAPWQRQTLVQLLAAALGVLPLYSTLLLLELSGDRSIPLRGFILYLAVISPVATAFALLLLRVLCGETPAALNLRPGSFIRDLLAALLLSCLIVIASVVSISLLAQLFPQSATNQSVIALFTQVTASRTLLVLFVGPLVLLGAASEEVIRALLLSRSWKVWPSVSGRLAAVAVSACLFGLIHSYQGAVHVGWAMIFGLIMALYYLWFGRVVPLVLAHYATNALQIVVFAQRTR